MFIPDLDFDFSRIPDPGSRGQKGTSSRILDPDLQHCEKALAFSQKHIIQSTFRGTTKTTRSERRSQLIKNPIFSFDFDLLALNLHLVALPARQLFLALQKRALLRLLHLVNGD
jgi:hypothetical protein